MNGLTIAELDALDELPEAVGAVEFAPVMLGRVPLEAATGSHGSDSGANFQTSGYTTAVDQREDGDEPKKPVRLCPARLAAMRRLVSVDKPTTEDIHTARVMATLIERADAALCDAEAAAELVDNFLFAADRLDRVARLG